jgi:hypothetical protein
MRFSAFGRSARPLVAVLTAVLAPALLTGASATAAGSAARAGTWGSAIQIPGIARLNTAGSSGPESLSCGAAGNCAVGGSYAIRPFCDTNYVCHYQAFVASEVRGTWRDAREVPGTAALDKGLHAEVTAVSCSAAGYCGAGGYYTDGAKHQQAFVVSEVAGIWHTAKEVPGTAALNAKGLATVSTISCTSPGNCAVGGSYKDSAGHAQAFVENEVRGAWRPAHELAGIGVLNTGGSAQVVRVSCRSAGTCAAAGNYTDASHNSQVFVATEANGSWAPAKEIPGTAQLNAGASAKVADVSCGSPGNCVVGGTYTDAQGNPWPFVAEQVGGSWDSAIEVPGAAKLAARGGDGELAAVSCPAAGNCVAGGVYDTNGYDENCCGQAFVVSETNGTWGQALRVPGTRKLNSGDQGSLTSVSCTSPGNCTAGGNYGVGSFGNKVYDNEVYVISEVNGRWGTAIQVPGTAALNKGHQAYLVAVSCSAAGRCSAAGAYWGSKSYAPSAHYGRPFIVSQR